MNYKIDVKQWGRFFSVPCSVVDDYILLSDGDFVKVLLCILCSNSNIISVENLSKQAGVSEEKAEDAIIHWSTLGVISAQTEDGKALDPQPQIHNNQVSASVGTVESISIPKSPTDAKTRVKYSTREIAEKIDANDELKGLFDAMQTVLKRIINGTEMAAILNLYEYYNYSAASILMIAEFCVKIGKNRIAYIEKVAKSWFEQGICTYSEVEAEIVRQEAYQSYEKSIMRVFGVQNKLSKRQQEYVSQWNSMGFSVEMLEIAYDICMNNTNKLSFPYINKILENWVKKNIRTPKQYEKDDTSYKNNMKQTVSGEKKDTSYDLNELQQYLLNYNAVKDGGNKN
ncbi:MAG: DnaD domain protein [Ruminococcus sp.]|nr:DnaD domain protein [Ruminococcus sp.]